MTITCKTSKAKLFIAGKSTEDAVAWAKKLISTLLTANWGIPRQIISDRDRKFLAQMWRTIFHEMNTSLLYSTAYHPQTDGQSERTNQTTEIKLRYLLLNLEDAQSKTTIRCLRLLSESGSLTTNNSEPLGNCGNARRSRRKYLTCIRAPGYYMHGNYLTTTDHRHQKLISSVNVPTEGVPL